MNQANKHGNDHKRYKKTKQEKTDTQVVITYTKQARSKQNNTRYFYENIISLRKVHFPNQIFFTIKISSVDKYILL